MRRQPRDLHREVLKRDATQWSSDASWYAVWLGPPHGEDSVCLGRTERLPQARYWRAFPADGSYPRKFRTWTAAAAWLLEVHEGTQKVVDRAAAREEEAISGA